MYESWVSESFTINRSVLHLVVKLSSNCNSMDLCSSTPCKRLWMRLQLRLLLLQQRNKMTCLYFCEFLASNFISLLHFLCQIIGCFFLSTICQNCTGRIHVNTNPMDTRRVAKKQHSLFFHKIVQLILIYLRKYCPSESKWFFMLRSRKKEREERERRNRIRLF